MRDREQHIQTIPFRVDQPGIYRIKVQGRFSEGTTRHFDELLMRLEIESRGVTVTTLTGPVTDQAALHGIVARVRDAGLPLILLELVCPIQQGDDR